MDPELRQVANGCAYRVRSFEAYDVNGYRFHTSRHEQSRPNRRTTNTGIFTPNREGEEFYGIVQEIYELDFQGCKPLSPVIFKCHWFDPKVTRKTPSVGLVEIRQDSVLPGDGVYVVAQQATQVYYMSYPCKSDENLVGWYVVNSVLPHSKLPLPNNEDCHFDPNTYIGEFFQEDGSRGTFEVDQTEPVVDDDRVVEEEVEDEVDNARDLDLLDKILLGIGVDQPEAEEKDEGAADMLDSDDETYDPANPDHDDYF
jgi:hypothetical protein